MLVLNISTGHINIGMTGQFSNSRNINSGTDQFTTKRMTKFMWMNFPGEQPLHSMRAYCYDIKKGKLFTFKDLFGKYPGYQEIIVSETKKQIRKGGHNPDIIRDFDALAKKAGFYYDQNTIYLFFERGTISKNDNFQTVIDFSVFGEDSYKIFE